MTWTPDRWLAAFECDRCGRFSDFSSAPSTRLAQNGHSSPVVDTMLEESYDTRTASAEQDDSQQ